MVRRYADLGVVVALAVASAGALLLLPHGSLASWLLAILVVMVMPGYALLAALRPSMPPDPAAKVVAIVTFSIANILFASLFLHLTGWGVDRARLVILLEMTTVASCVVAAVRRARLGPRRLARPARQHARAKTWPATPRSMGLLAAAAAVTALAVVFARAPVYAEGVRGYTLLWTAPGATDKSVVVGIQSGELRPMTYTLSMRSTRPAGSWAAAFRETSVVETRISLAPGQRWQITVDARGLPTGVMLTFVLRRADRPGSVYRTVTAVVGATSGAGAAHPSS